MKHPQRSFAAFAETVLTVLALFGSVILVAILLELSGLINSIQAVLLVAALTPVVILLVYCYIAIVRWRFRFGLKSLLLFNAACGFGLAFVGWHIKNIRDETGAILKLQSASAEISYADRATPDWLRRLLGEEVFARGSVTDVRLGLRDRTKFLSDSSFSHVSGLKHLRSLEVFGPKITDSGLRVLSYLKALEVLHLQDVPVTDEGLKSLADLNQLKVLRLNSTRITDAGLRSLAGLKRLEVLALDGSQVTDEGITQLGNLRNLKVLSLNDTLVTNQAVAQLRNLLPDAVITNEKIVPRDQRVAIERIWQMGGVIQHHAGAVKVTIVDLAINGGNDVTDKDLAQLTALPDVEILELGNNSGITDQGLAHLSKLSQLRTLHLHHTGVRGPGLRHVVALPKLTSLNLQATPLTDEGVMILKQSGNLRSLILHETSISDDAIAKLRTALPKCNISAELKIQE